ncbi:MAG TPA: SRPBCC family protein [Acidimicrobiia bacterium]|nr:SRPBCC family protein [Acidimicrobiia bacterium]
MNTLIAPPRTDPIHVSSEKVVDIDISRVFAYVADLRNTPAWNRAITSTRPLAPGTTGVGSRFEQTRTVPRRATETVEITDYEADRLLDVTVTDRGHPVQYRYEFHPGTVARTRIRLTVTLYPDHPIGRPDYYRARLARVLDSNLTNLRTALLSSR